MWRGRRVKKNLKGEGGKREGKGGAREQNLRYRNMKERQACEKEGREEGGRRGLDTHERKKKIRMEVKV